MTLEVAVHVTCPEDAKEQPIEAVLRINETELALWYFLKTNRSEFWLRWKYRPFRGPWPIQLLLTPFFSPIILFGKRHLSWIKQKGELSCLRIASFVPADFWVDIHLACREDSEAVVEATEVWWHPPSAKDRKKGHIFWLVRKWWRVCGIAFFLFAMVSLIGPGHCTDFGAGAVLSAVGFVGFLVYIVAILFVEVFSSRKEQPPQKTRSMYQSS